MNVTKKVLGAFVLLVVIASSAVAISVYTLPSLRMNQAGGSLQESLVKVDSFDLNSNRKVNSVSVKLNNTDIIPHLVDIFVSLENYEGMEVSNGNLSNNSILPKEAREVIVALSSQPDLTSVAETFITLKEIK